MYIISDLRQLMNQLKLQLEFQPIQEIHQSLVILEMINKIITVKIYHTLEMVHHTVIQSDGKSTVIIQSLVAIMITMFSTSLNLNVIQNSKIQHSLYQLIYNVNTMLKLQLKAKSG